MGQQLSGKGREAGLGQTNPEVATWHPGSPQARREDKKEQSRIQAGVQCPALQLSYFLLLILLWSLGSLPWERGRLTGPIEGNSKDWVTSGQAGPTSKFLMLRVFCSMAFRVEGDGEEDEVRVVEWGRVETK